MFNGFLVFSVALSSASLSLAQQVPASLEVPNNGVFELRNTFWHIEQLRSFSVDLSGVVVRILVLTPDGENGSITFSSPNMLAAFPFVYEAHGLEFGPAHTRIRKGDDQKSVQDEQAGRSFGSALQDSCGYELSGRTLTFVDKERHPLIVLTALRQAGLENRRWRISKYRDSESAPDDRLTEAKEPADITFMNGRLDGSPGCGAWLGTYVLAGRKLTTDADSVLAGLCSSDQLKESYRVKKDLRGDTRIEMSGNQTFLRNRNGKAMILLTPY